MDVEFDHLDELTSGVGTTADWRRRKLEQYPDDLRNLNAAEMLESLKPGLEKLRGSDLHKQYERVCNFDIETPGWEDKLFALEEMKSAKLRSVCFHYFPRTAEEFLADAISDFKQITEEDNA